MALDTGFKIQRHNLVTLIDGTAVTPIELDLDCVTSHVINLPEKEDLIFRCRGAVSGTVEGDDVVIEFAFTEHWKEYTNATAGVSRDFMKARNGYSANVTTNAIHAKNAFDIQIVTDKTTGQTTDPQVTFLDCVLLGSVVTPAPEGTMVEHTVRCYGGFTEVGE